MLRPALVALVTSIAALGQSPGDRAVQILNENCVSCHGTARMSGLDLRTREAMLAGGKRGPAIVPGKPLESPLLQAVARTGELKMPPGNRALSAEQVSILRDWIAAGAELSAKSSASEPTWWSFRQPVRTAAESIDQLQPPANPEADRRTLIRRATYDLTGLPPTPEELQQFLNDTDPNAYEKLIDRLLASPRYGERWGRMWLDVVRYADTGGYETDVLFPNAWRYRDYVIRSFNTDKPYDVFIKEQIAGDELWPDNLELEGSYDLPASKKANLERRIGTSLYTLGALPVENSFYGDQYRAEWQADSVDVTGAAFLGLSLNCARCHDHKFDPISQRDYYRLSAVFAGSEDREVPIVSQMRIFEYTRFQTKQWIVDELRRKYNRTDPKDKDVRETLLRAIGEAYIKAPVMYDKANLLVPNIPVPDTHVLVRGEWKQKGEKVTPGFPAVFGASREIVEPESPWFVPKRRSALAEWIASREHPLTARVMVNRIWQGHFRRGLVATPNDFGRQGDQPTNPKLLDWLAVEFMDRGWSIKQLHRLIMTSAAYRAKGTPRRLEAEAIRDSILAASGALNTKMFGPPVVTPLAEDEREAMRDLTMWPVNSDETEYDRRSVYLFIKRSFRLPMLATFDAPDTSQSCARRDTSTVAPQALTLMNSEWIDKQAGRLAARLAKSADPINDGWLLTLGRPPDTEERAKAKAFLERNGNNLQQLGLLLFNLSEFLYVN